MREFKYVLGNVVKQARNDQNLTQEQVASKSNIDVRTILNIENYKGNPKLENLFPLIRALKISADDIFYPELRSEKPQLRRLHLLIEDCSEPEAELLSDIVSSVLRALRSSEATEIKVSDPQCSPLTDNQ